MPNDAAAEVSHEAEAVKADTAVKAAEQAKQSLEEAIAHAERTITEAVKAAERVLREGLEKLREQGKPLTENAGQQLDDAQRYVTERVKERPVTSAVAGLGIGLILGLLLSNRSK